MSTTMNKTLEMDVFFFSSKFENAEGKKFQQNDNNSSSKNNDIDNNIAQHAKRKDKAD